MLLNLLGMAALIFLAYAFFTLFLRSLRSPNLGVKLLGGLLSAVLALAFAAATGAILFGIWRMDAPRDRAVADLKVAGSPEQIERGRTLAEACIGCHSSDGTAILNGGMTNLIAPLGSYGELYAPNLTPGGEIRNWSDGEIVRAIREGVDDRGVPLMLHPASAYYWMDDADAEALVAYLRSLPALRHDQPPRHLNLFGKLAVAAGLLPTSELPPRSIP